MLHIILEVQFLYFTRHEISNTILVSILRLDSKMSSIGKYNCSSNIK